MCPLSPPPHSTWTDFKLVATTGCSREEQVTLCCAVTEVVVGETDSANVLADDATVDCCVFSKDAAVLICSDAVLIRDRNISAVSDTGT